jgi:hypothetical protein
MNTQIENLQNEKSKIIDSWKNTAMLEKDLEPIRLIEKQIKDLQKLDLINEVNSKQARLRELAKQAFECETPLNDILCNDGSFHAVKVKKYPKIAALQYARGVLKDGLLYELTLNGEKFRLYKTKYEYNKTDVHTKITDFKEFLQHNSIMVENITIKQYNDIAAKAIEINKNFAKQVELFKAQQNELNLSSLNYYGLFNHENAGHIYQYSPKR